MAREGKFSYSKLNTFQSCGFKYKLTYVDGHYIYTDSLASELGSTLHKCEEYMFNELRFGRQIDYEKVKDMFLNIKIDKKDKFDTEGGIYGINILKEKYKEDFYKVDDNGQSYFTKTLDYLNFGMHRLEEYLKANPDLEPFDCEKYVCYNYNGHVIGGFIDRIFYNRKTGEYIIEDIKTKGKPFKDEELITPLQLVIYTIGLHECLDIPYDKISCVYDLPILGIRQSAGTKGYVARGKAKLEKIFDGIAKGDWTPSPTPLCHWCSYCPTNPEQTEEAKNLCPYYSLWTRENKTREVSHKWRGMEFIEEDLSDEIAKHSKSKPKKLTDEFDFDF